MARRSVHSRGNHAAAAWFPFHSTGFLLVAYGHGAVVHFVHAQARRLRILARSTFANCSRRRPIQEKHYFQRDGRLNKAFLRFDHIGRVIDPLIPKRMRDRAIRGGETWMLARLNGEDGLGAIFPAMVNALEAMVILGYPQDHPQRVTAKRALQKLLVVGPSSAYCQPCVSPIWDTALACLAMQEAGDDAARHASARGLDWLKTKQLLDEPGDWRVRRPDLPGGGWAFNSQMISIRTSTIPRWSPGPCIRRAIRRATPRACAVRWIGWLGCKVATAALPHSTPTIPATT